LFSSLNCRSRSSLSASGDAMAAPERSRASCAFDAQPLRCS
jgi:hypothetical protein